MQDFVDKTDGVDGFMKPVSKTMTRGKPKTRLMGVHKYSEGADGIPVEKARLIFNYAPDKGQR